ncbi:MAG: enoyl-CoA hydratase/isomerase family protein [Deltaproteobacteria bacterium]|nr:enoyl-CoA hydratase/isomerase family protein [Deltaproteobacteria bacterium]
MLRRRREGSILVLTLDRPEVRNAISRDLAEMLVSAIEDASRDRTVTAIVLASSHAQVFVAGGDLRELLALPYDARGAEAVLELGATTSALEEAAVPVIAALDGAALGGGAELTVACDLVVMGRQARVQFVHARMGLVPAWGGLTRLEEKVGAARASELILTARAVHATDAVAMGLANRSAEHGREAALDLARELTTHTRDALVALKASLREARRRKRSDALEAEREAFRRAWGSDAHRAAFDALRER